MVQKIWCMHLCKYIHSHRETRSRAHFALVLHDIILFSASLRWTLHHFFTRNTLACVIICFFPEGYSARQKGKLWGNMYILVTL